MTTPAGVANCPPRLHDSIQMVRGVISRAGYGVPASAVTSESVASWVRTHGVTVIACDDDELELLRCSGIRPVQMVFRCGAAVDSSRHAASLGVTRFIVDSARQMAGLASCAQRTKYVYLDERAPLVFGDRGLRIIGVHTDVEESAGAAEWAAAAERLLCRTALLKTCGTPVSRIVISGGPLDIWVDGDAPLLSSVAHGVDGALRDGCARWRLARPAVTLTPPVPAGPVGRRRGVGIAA